MTAARPTTCGTPTDRRYADDDRRRPIAATPTTATAPPTPTPTTAARPATRRPRSAPDEHIRTARRHPPRPAGRRADSRRRAVPRRPAGPRARVHRAGRDAGGAGSDARAHPGRADAGAAHDRHRRRRAAAGRRRPVRRRRHRGRLGRCARPTRRPARTRGAADDLRAGSEPAATGSGTAADTGSSAADTGSTADTGGSLATDDTSATGERAPLVPADRAESYATRWNEVKGMFVDEPRQAVQQADGLVGELLDDLRARCSASSARTSSRVLTTTTRPPRTCGWRCAATAASSTGCCRSDPRSHERRTLGPSGRGCVVVRPGRRLARGRRIGQLLHCAGELPARHPRSAAAGGDRSGRLRHRLPGRRSRSSAARSPSRSFRIASTTTT